MKAKVICPSCKEDTMLLEEDMREDAVTMEDGQPIYITSWICPKCHHKHAIHLDNPKTKELFEQLKTQMSLLRRNSSMGVSCNQEISKAASIGETIDVVRNELQARYDGSLYQLGDLKEQLDICIPEASILD